MACEERPRARSLDAIPIEFNGEQAILLRDPLRLTAEVIVPPAVYFFLANCDGTKTLAEIKLAFTRQFQVILAPDDAERILHELDSHYLLDNERFRRLREHAVSAWRAEKIRRASHQGEAYPADPEDLRAELDSYYTLPEGPGIEESSSEQARKPVLGLIAPHISVRLGGVCFAWAYKRVRESQPAQTYVILGTGHAEVPGCFAATRKAFQTPFGLSEVDCGFLDRLEQHFGGDLCAEEIYHRSEHVIEFQLIFLQHALAGRADFRIVPILCSFGPEALADGPESEQKSAVIERFCEALRKTVAEWPGRVCIICSADLAHVGWRYGDPIQLGREYLTRLEQDDRRMLEIICSGDAEGFLNNLASEGNRRRICGFPCIYTMLRAVDLKEGQLLRYDQSRMDDRNSTVSYASVVFYG